MVGCAKLRLGHRTAPSVNGATSEYLEGIACLSQFSPPRVCCLVQQRFKQLRAGTRHYAPSFRQRDSEYQGEQREGDGVTQRRRPPHSLELLNGSTCRSADEGQRFRFSQPSKTVRVPVPSAAVRNSLSPCRDYRRMWPPGAQNRRFIMESLRRSLSLSLI